MKAQSYIEGSTSLPYTASADITAGAVLAVAGQCGVAMNDIADTKTDDLQTSGIVLVEKVNEEITKGDIVYFDNDGNPYLGTSGSGAATKVVGNGDLEMGTCTETAAAGAKRVKVLLNVYPATNTLNSGSAVA